MDKRVLLGLAFVAIIIAALAFMSSVGQNLFSNPSVENGTQEPVNWNEGYHFADCYASYSWGNPGHTGNRCLWVNTTTCDGNDSKWWHNLVPVEGSSIKVSDWYKSNTDTEIHLWCQTKSGDRYPLVAFLPPAQTWTKFEKIVELPPDTREVTIFHTVDTPNSNLCTDDYYLGKTTWTDWIYQYFAA